MSNKYRPLLLVVSAPSGAGKSSLCNRLIEKFPEMIYSVSCTTRPPRGAEENGVHYHFLSEEAFSAHLRAGDFLEHATVHGNRYGTLKKTVYDALAQGRDIIMDIDVQGAQQIRSACSALRSDDAIKQSFVDIFIAPPSIEELHRRLCGRSTDRADVIERRMRNAIGEMEQRTDYQYTVINDDFETAANELIAIITHEHNQRA